MVERTYIGIFGPRNAGKSTLINLLTNQEVSIVSDVAGTTTDPVSKPIEINGLGACVFIDTAGYDDEGAVGTMRVTKTKEVLKRCEIALFVLPNELLSQHTAMQEATQWYTLIKERCNNTLLIVNQFNNTQTTADTILGTKPIVANIKKGEGKEEILAAIGHTKERYQQERSIVTHLIKKGDCVVLVMPQDTQAPTGRLILPQVQTIRELLDFGATIVSCTTENFRESLAKLAQKPDLIVTDSQAFGEVYSQKPEEVRLTSFSVLFAKWKGDIEEYIEGVKTLSKLNKNSRILIAEACTHAPLSEDIGREKIPFLIHKNIDKNIHIDFVAGNDWSENLDTYDLIIHCGACMISQTQVQNRILEAKKHNTPITNYGIVIAYFTKILNKIVW